MSKVIEQLKNDPQMPLRHSCEHVLHMAAQELFPELKKVMGPPIENGFYFDFDLDYKITADDFEKLENLMGKIIKASLPIKRIETTQEEARKIFKDNPYKLATLDEIKTRGEGVSLYVIGAEGEEHYDLDLCSGPHVANTGEIKAFKLLSVAGAYYKGDEKNKMLQRIYGTAFESKEKLENYLTQIEEAKKRDHRKLGQELELFFFHETAPGIPYWLPKGLILYNELVKFWKDEHSARNYQEIASPLINKKELWEISGHWEHYKNDMFIADMGENEVYGIKPMNCPNAMVVFGSRPRSYRELPLRLSDTDTLHRYELAGTMHGLMRVRSFRQDDSHNFITEEMIESEYEEIFEIAKKFYGIFNMDFRYRLGTRPEKFMGDIDTWNKAEASLHKILEKSVGKDNYFVEEGDGAFYGPKVDIVMKDSLGRDWQMGTIQLDFQIPRKFDLKYIDSEGQRQTPVVIHRVIYGSLERFIGILIEHFGGAFPAWLSPVQAMIIPISEKHFEYSHSVLRILKEQGIRAEIDDRGEKMQSRIRDAQVQKIPYMLIIGDKETEANSVSVRLRTEENIGSIAVTEFCEKLEDFIKSRSLNLW